MILIYILQWGLRFYTLYLLFTVVPCHLTVSPPQNFLLIIWFKEIPTTPVIGVTRNPTQNLFFTICCGRYDQESYTKPFLTIFCYLPFTFYATLPETYDPTFQT